LSFYHEIRGNLGQTVGIRDVSPFVQVSVRGHIGSESITPRTGSEAPNGTQRLTLD
jgi:hypothetical protein